MLLTQEEYAKRMIELQSIRIQLDPDPVTTGLGSINRKIAELQGHRDTVTRLLIEALNNKTEADLILENVKGEYNREVAQLLATDPDVQNQKSEKARQAAADNKLYEKVLKVHHSEMDYKIADSYFRGVQQLYSNLESVNTNLSRQISVVQMQMNIGEIAGGTNFQTSLQGKTLTIKKEGE